MISGGQFYYQSRGTVSRPFAYSTLTDPDDSDYNGAVLQIVTTSAYQQNKLLMGDLFSRANSQILFDGTVIGSADDAGGSGSTPLVITFNSSATIDIIQRLIQSLRFEASLDAGPETGLKITATITDIHGVTSAPSETTINVT